MNVLLHTTTAVGIAVLLTDTKRIEQSPTRGMVVLTGFFAFTVGLISHGVLDYIPHCYPINSKLDALGGLTMILLLTWLTNRKYRLIMILAFLGAIVPDVIDLSPAILNKQLGLDLPSLDKLFPWHWQEYSGSVYNSDCNVSTLNHLILLFTIAVVCWCRRSDIRMLF